MYSSTNWITERVTLTPGIVVEKSWINVITEPFNWQEKLAWAANVVEGTLRLAKGETELEGARAMWHKCKCTHLLKELFAKESHIAANRMSKSLDVSRMLLSVLSSCVRRNWFISVFLIIKHGARPSCLSFNAFTCGDPFKCDNISGLNIWINTSIINSNSDFCQKFQSKHRC